MFSYDERFPRYNHGPSFRALTSDERLRRQLPEQDRYSPPARGAVGYSYTDPVYGQIEAPLEAELGLPKGLLAAVRTRGERSNADRVSPDPNYAQTVYQITPHTRSLFRSAYDGIDAYEGLKQAARVAALHLLESYRSRRGGGHDWNRAVAEYNGGPNEGNWGPINEDYRRRVGDFMHGRGLPVPPAPSRRRGRR